MVLPYAPISGAAPAGIQALAAGLTGVPQVFANGARAATGKITFTDVPTAGDTLTINGHAIEFIANGESPVGQQVAVGGTAAATAAALDTYLGTATDTLLDGVTFDYTGGNAYVDITYDVQSETGNDFTLATDCAVVTLSDATLTGGASASNIDVRSELTILNTTAGDAQYFVLPDGQDGQWHTFYFASKGAGANAIVTGTFASAADEATFDAEGEKLVVRWLGDAWHAMMNPDSVSIG